MAQLADFPVYAVGVTPNGPLKEGGGEMNYPVACGGQVVCPGDILVGDADGVAVIPATDAREVLAEAQTQHAKELQVIRDIENLSWYRKWVDTVLHAKGCGIME